MENIRKIIHIDMDAFFASVEQLDNPNLKGKPVIVGGDPDKRGVVAACSYEARRYGIHSSMPCSRAIRLCPEAVFTAPRMWRYRQISQQVMKIFFQYTDLVEPMSLDEAYLDITRNTVKNRSASLLAETIRLQIYEETGLTASAGVSYNKFLAKIASDLNKPNGSSTIPPGNALAFLNKLTIGKFFGVGEVTKRKMYDLGIHYGEQLRALSREDLIFHFGKSGSFFFDMARGIDTRPVTPTRERKSIGCEKTLQIDTCDSEEINALLMELAIRVEQALRQRNCCGTTLTLKVRYHDFVTISRSVTRKHPLACKEEILSSLTPLLRSTAVATRKVRLLGITLSKLRSREVQKPMQLPLPF